MTIEEILGLSPVMPVLVIERAEDAVPLARALVAGGLRALEVTLRTEAALEAVRRIRAEVSGAVAGVGTALDVADLEAAAAAGARFAVSPGLDDAMLQSKALPLLPAAATGTEVMRALKAGRASLKFFPAVPSGGVAALKAFQGPFPAVRFCPTGGIGAANAAQFLALGNVACVGGSWVAPPDAIAEKDWGRIHRLAKAAAALGPQGAGAIPGS